MVEVGVVSIQKPHKAFVVLDDALERADGFLIRGIADGGRPCGEFFGVGLGDTVQIADMKPLPGEPVRKGGGFGTSEHSHGFGFQHGGVVEFFLPGKQDKSVVGNA